jgi:hypothetical protein
MGPSRTTCRTRAALHVLIVEGADVHPRSWTYAAPHRRAARGADVSLPLDHAGCDAINVGNTLPAQALRVTLTGSPLLGSALGGGRNRHERYSPYGGKREKRWDRIMHEMQNFSFDPLRYAPSRVEPSVLNRAFCSSLRPL